MMMMNDKKHTALCLMAALQLLLPPLLLPPLLHRFEHNKI
jgi:hypothetical protein